MKNGLKKRCINFILQGFTFKFKIVVLIHYPKVIDALVETDGIMTELDQLNKSLPHPLIHFVTMRPALHFRWKKNICYSSADF